MEFISSFTKTLVCVIVISFILKSLLPKSALEKYINFVIGLIVSVTLVGAFSNAGAVNFEDIVIADEGSTITEQEARGIYNRKLADGIETDLKRSVRGIVYEVSGCESECDVMLRLEMDGSVSAVDGIYVRVYGYCDNAVLRDEISRRMQLDTGIVHIGGDGYE